MANEQPDVPEGLIKLLQDFTIAILQSKPKNIPRFAVSYFTRLANNSESSMKSENKHSVDTDNSEDMDDEYAEKMMEMAAQWSSTRRGSVTAEPFNPEEDEENEGSLEGRRNSFYEKTPEQIARLKDVCRKIVLFSELDDAELVDVINAMFTKTAEPEEDIIKQHDDGDNFYVIDSGRFEVKIEDRVSGVKVVKVYENEGFFGELALMYNSPRSATVTAVTEGILWALSRQSFRRHVLGHAAKRRRAFIELLHSVPILQDLTSYQRMSLADNLQLKSIPKSEIIIREGEPGDALFFVMEGVVGVRRRQGSTEKELGKIEKGGYFGELALLSNKPRAASVYAVTDVTLAMLGVESFERLLGPCIGLMKDQALDYESHEDTI
ncbi:cAMP dependent protein kinase type II regulatory [Echinococcus multilocularis]|uniref:cAMP dependent protein kinase type II regulatory n=1 Tax=Echinococcus multilocularis TaxID=6211 RepID=A0A068YJM9_ECHMU|nr:cAMP dependent protein kinase type II regulatory [Echinococcus multilocularis]